MERIAWSVGDWVIYRKSKRSHSPGPRAQNVTPASKGDSYAYTVDKYWIVTEVFPDGHLLVRTLRGKQHKLLWDDPSIRKPRFWERWLLGGRYREIEKSFENTPINSAESSDE